MMKADQLNRIGKFTLYGAVGFGVGAIGFGEDFVVRGSIASIVEVQDCEDNFVLMNIKSYGGDPENQRGKTSH